METRKLLRRLRIEHELTLEELAKKLGCSYQRIQHHESGIRKISMEAIKQYATFYNIPVSTFIGEPEKRKTIINTLLDSLIEEGILNDLDQIPQATVNMIMGAVKLELQYKQAEAKKRVGLLDDKQI